MAVLILPACLSCADHKAAMGDAAVVSLQLLLTDEMHRRVIIREIVGHCHDSLLNGL